MQSLTYIDIVTLEPCILKAEALAREYAGCPTYERWYDEVKPAFKPFVGWMSKHPDERLHSSEAYNAVYSYLINIYESGEKTTMDKSEIIIDGVVCNRIPFGTEQEYDGDDNCPDCGVKRGEFHLQGCDQETCPKCQGQLIACDCEARPVGADECEGDTPEEPTYDAPKALGASEIGRRLSRVSDLLRFADAGLGATHQGNHGAQLVIHEALREIEAIMDSPVKVAEVAIPF
jgi:hypothetical protein